MSRMPLAVLFPWSAAALAGVAAALSLFLFVKTVSGGRLPGCGPASTCDSVTTSRWARWWRIPVALPAMLLYLTIVALLVMPRAGVTLPRSADGALAGLCLLAIASAVWFVAIQAFVLRRFCVWCMVDHTVGVSAAVLALAALWPQVRSEPALPLAVALAPLAILILGQLLIEPRTYEVQQPKGVPDRETITRPKEPPMATPQPTSTAPSVPAPAPALPPSSPPPAMTPSKPEVPIPAAIAQAAAAASQAPAVSPPPRVIVLLEGRLKVLAATFPLIGRADAKHVFVDLLDYTCDHCRELHHWLTQARAHFKDELAVLAIPLPMEPACNPFIQFPNRKHVNACTYTRYALAVWHADRAKFHEYHEWLYEPARPPHLEDARGRAEQLVGPRAFASALADPAIESQIKNALGIYQFLGGGQIPKLVMNRGVLVGQIPSLQRLIQLIEADFQPKPPPPPPQDEITTSFIGGFR